MRTIEVSLSRPNVVEWREGSEVRASDVDEAFDRIDELTAGVSPVYLMMDLSMASRPASEVRERLRRRVSAIRARLRHVAVFTGDNDVLNVTAKFVYANLGLRSFSAHHSREEAMAEISALTDPSRSKEELTALVIRHLLEINERRCSITESTVLAERDPALREILAAFLCLAETMTSERTAPTQLFDEFYESAPDMFCTIALPSARILHCNRAFAEMLGQPASQLAGRTVFSAYREGSRPSLHQAIHDLLHRDVVRNVELEMDSPSGHPLSVLLSGCAVRDDQQNVIAAQLIGREITGLKRAMPLEVPIDDLDAPSATESVEELAALASHDLQEPLRQVGTYADLLSNEYAQALDARGQEHLRYIVDGVSSMRQLVSGLMSCARTQGGAAPLRPTLADGALDRALANLKQSLDEAGAQIRRSALPAVLADEGQLVQLFQNLIDNAVKYRGGAAPVQVSIAAKRSQAEWIFAISDNGIGIPAEHQQRVFEVFGRLHGEEGYPGAGLGLPIAKRVVERHGGRIWIESGNGRGTTIYFSLPAVQRAPAGDEGSENVLKLHPTEISSAANALRRLKAEMGARGLA